MEEHKGVSMHRSRWSRQVIFCFNSQGAPTVTQTCDTTRVASRHDVGDKGSRKDMLLFAHTGVFYWMPACRADLLQ